MLGTYFVQVTDNSGCSVSVDGIVIKEERDICPELTLCERKRDFDNKILINCLRKVAAPFFFNLQKYDICGMRAGFEIAKILLISDNKKLIVSEMENTADHGSIFLGMLLSRGLALCREKRTTECMFEYHYLDNIMSKHRVIYKEYQQFMQVTKTRNWISFAHLNKREILVS